MSSSTPKTTHEQTWFHYVTAAVLVAISVISTSEMRVRLPIPHFQEAIASTIESAECEGRPLLTHYTGVEAIDVGLRVLVAVFLPGAAGYDKGYQVLQIYFLVAFFAVVSIWCIESGRGPYRASIVGFPAVWSLFYQTLGGAIIIPCYYLAYMYVSARRQDCFSAEATAIPSSFAKALTPSLVIGYLLPTVLMYLPSLESFTRQRVVAFWQICPLFVSLLTSLLSGFSAQSSSKTLCIKYLNRIYAVVFVTTSVLHIGTIAYFLTSTDSEASFEAAFDPRVSHPASPLVAGVKYIFQVDFWGIFAASLVWAYLAIYNLKSAGWTNVSMIRAALYMMVGTGAVGPAAVLSAVWYWREQVLAIPQRAKSA